MEWLPWLKHVSIIVDSYWVLRWMECLTHRSIADHDRLLMWTCTETVDTVDQVSTVMLVAEGSINHGGKWIAARSAIHATSLRSQQVIEEVHDEFNVNVRFKLL